MGTRNKTERAPAMTYQVWNTYEDVPHSDTVYSDVEEAAAAMMEAGKDFPEFAVPLALVALDVTEARS
jgi:hypothetical protein